MPGLHAYSGQLQSKQGMISSACRLLPAVRSCVGESNVVHGAAHSQEWMLHDSTASPPCPLVKARGLEHASCPHKLAGCGAGTSKVPWALTAWPAPLKLEPSRRGRCSTPSTNSASLLLRWPEGSGSGVPPGPPLWRGAASAVTTAGG